MKYKTYKQVRSGMMALHDQVKNWARVGEKYGISGGTAHRIAKQGLEPRDPEIRSRLGLSAMDLAPTCYKCGEVHVTRTCQKGRKPTVIKRLDDYSVKDLRWALDHREEF